MLCRGNVFPKRGTKCAQLKMSKQSRSEIQGCGSDKKDELEVRKLDALKS